MKFELVENGGGAIALAAGALSEDSIPLLWPLAGGLEAKGAARIGRVSLGFGTMIDPFTGKEKLHTGMDIAAAMGTPVIATGLGIVTDAGSNPDAGSYVTISHPSGFKTYYSHLMADVRVRKGDTVEAGQVIASLGSSGRSTGPHLHYEVIHDSQNLDPMHVVGAYLRGTSKMEAKEEFK